MGESTIWKSGGRGSSEKIEDADYEKGGQSRFQAAGKGEEKKSTDSAKKVPAKEGAKKSFLRMPGKSIDWNGWQKNTKGDGEARGGCHGRQREKRKKERKTNA